MTLNGSKWPKNDISEMSRFTRFARHKFSAARHLKLFCTPDDHLAKLFHILVVTLIQETELRCFRALRANASKIFIFQQFKEVLLGNVKS